MIKMTILNRLILLLTGHLAGYMIVAGIEGLHIWTTLYYTIAFGVLTLSCLLLMLFGYEILNNIMVVVVATLIPLSLSLGIISSYLPKFKFGYLIFAVFGLALIFLTRIRKQGKLATMVLAVVHGLAGLLITFLPIILSLKNITSPWFSLVGFGGALIGLAGLLLAFLKTGKAILSQKLIYSSFPTLLLVVTALFVAGLSFSQEIFTFLDWTQGQEII